MAFNALEIVFLYNIKYSWVDIHNFLQKKKHV